MLALYCADSKYGEDWLPDMQDMLERTPVVYFWRHQLPDGSMETVEKLREQINQVGFIPIYLKVKENYYLLIAIDFVLDATIEGIPDEWAKKYVLAYPLSLALKRHINKNREFLEKWSQHKWKGRKPRILFAVSSIQQINPPVGVNWALNTRCAVKQI